MTNDLANYLSCHGGDRGGMLERAIVVKSIRKYPMQRFWAADESILIQQIANNKYQIALCW